MTLKIPEYKSWFTDPITVKRSPQVREGWVSHYDKGHRLCRVIFADLNCHAVLTERPVIKGGSITFKFLLFVVSEVWGGLDGRLSSVFVRFNGVTYIGEALSGWKFKPTDISFANPSHRTSGEAEYRALDFLEKHSDSLLTNKPIIHERHETTDTAAINPGPQEGADLIGGQVHRD